MQNANARVLSLKNDVGIFTFLCKNVEDTLIPSNDLVIMVYDIQNFTIIVERRQVTR